MTDNKPDQQLRGVLGAGLRKKNTGETGACMRQQCQDMHRENAELKAKLEKAEARVKELEDLIKSDTVYTLLRFGVKSPSGSGMDDFEGSENIDLYNISVELRK
jgi:hypothetical protein